MFTLRIMRNATFVIFFAAASFVACGDAEPMKSNDYCSRLCDCEACSAEERTSCDTTLGNLSFRARNKGCVDPYLTYVVCRIDNGQCTNGVYDETDCDDEKTRLDNCMDGSSCPFTNNGQCDEPQGTGQCPSGTDSNDCNGLSCPFINNGQCDEPQGTGQCPPGTDFNDCNGMFCPFTNNGVCDEPQGTGQCAPGTDFNDCNGMFCPFTNNGVCDEPQGTGQCPAGTDFNDCSMMFCVRCADFIGNGAQGTLCPESKLIFDNLLTCMCNGPCQVECGNNFCIDFKMVTMECQTCVNGPCSAEFATCANDI